MSDTYLDERSENDHDRQSLRRVHEILEEAEETDRAEDEEHGDQRGDELPQEMQTEEGRRAAFREAKQRLSEKPTAATATATAIRVRVRPRPRARRQPSCRCSSSMPRRSSRARMAVTAGRRTRAGS